MSVRGEHSPCGIDSPPQDPSVPPGLNVPGRARSTPGQRVFAGLVALACLGVLMVASGLAPDERGLGTHTQLNLPECGWKLAAGRPCPTCGMTTAFAGMATGSPLQALRAQPMGALLALATAVTFWVAVHVAVTGSRLGLLFLRLARPGALWVIVALWLASWAYKLATFTGPDGPG